MESKSPNTIPNHVAIIMDGNNRWASERNLPGVTGHQKGVERAREAVEFAVKKGISTLTIFAFSSENWGRSNDEVNLLMKLLNTALKEQVPNLIKNSVQLNFIGDLSQFDNELLNQMKKSEELTACDDKEKQLDLVVAASYGGRWDIINAVNRLNDSNQESISEDDLTSLLSTAKFNDPDLCIRTGKEQRISNFLLWQLAYTELYFPDLLWPDFNDDEFEKALIEYSTRTRRFGDKSNFSL
ncbi:MAG TPA: polyprenyl diphosphate synthase [SAR86 cluster bacterium]|jgi:undecaprenyl diphosphate synthase|nr:polyprenyl diphosphate synthase [SAR86 cluster bacterium]HJM15160.1 polyprenyl diphosphate synthase [SAR86 cluster bacterium]